jgi:NADH-quinone oxidoreductase subunit L
MIMGVGVGAYQAGVLHFFTHAFFKAQLFLGAGIIIHALNDEQDVRKMGGLYRRMPFAFWAMLLGTLAIIGFPFFSGSYSKDAVIYGTLEHGHGLLYLAGVLTAGITAFYMFRMIFVVFFGPDRSDVPDDALAIPPAPHAAHAEDHDAAHAPAWLMNVPVAILMVPTVAAGWLSIGGNASPWYQYFGTMFGTSENVAAPPLPIPELASQFIVYAIVTVGVIIAYLRYGTPEALRDSVARLRAEGLRMPVALRRAFWFDDVIALAIVRPAQALGSFIGRVIDPHVIDAGVRDVAWFAGALGFFARALQNGLVRTYALTLAIGAACFIAYFAVMGAPR